MLRPHCYCRPRRNLCENLGLNYAGKGTKSGSVMENEAAALVSSTANRSREDCDGAHKASCSHSRPPINQRCGNMPRHAESQGVRLCKIEEFECDEASGRRQA